MRQPRTASASVTATAAAVAAVLLASLGALPAAAQARSLWWPEIEVTAHLDGEGRLQVSEQQTMMFSGDWNGGERRFDLRPGQRVDVRALWRLDAESGRWEEMPRGDLDQVHGWDLVSNDTVRWRSRSPVDPPFDDTTLTYRLDYALSGVLVPQGQDRYRLAHEFAFADRDGVIGELQVMLTADPAWRSSRLPVRQAFRELAPGNSPVVVVDFEWTGGGRPAGVPRSLPWTLRLAPFLAALAAMLVAFLRFYGRERRSPRFDPLPDLAQPPDREWLREHVFDRPAEEIGALWDRSVGTPEVTALLARLTSEGKLRSWSEPRRYGAPVLHLELLVPRQSLRSPERELVDGLFSSGSTVTDTESVKVRYKSTGFNPAAVIRPALADRLPEPRKRKELHPRWRRWLTPALLAAAVLAFALGVMLAAEATPLMLFTLPLNVLAAVAGAILASLWSTKVHWRHGLAVLLMLPALVALAGTGLAALLWGLVGYGSSGLLAFHVSAALLPLAVLSMTLYRARNTDRAETVHQRRRLFHARQHFRRQLARPQPDLEDAWVPYLLAFGLDGLVTGWERRWGVAAAGGGGALATAAASAGRSGSGGASPWTGGGGTFGGAGATAGWTAAAAGLASGVAAPSSSGSGGGGGGGGSSGGGGGGGW